MFAARSRAHICALIFVVSAPFASAQTVELITGQGRFVDIPGNTLGFQAGSMGVGPDGLLYLTDINKRLMRVNPATGRVTALPATSGGLNFEVGHGGFVFNAAGQLFTPLNGQLTRINPETGEKTPVGEFYYGGPMTFHPNGKLYFAPGDNKVYERLPSGEVNVIAGVGEESGFSGDGGPAVNAQLSYLQDMKLGPDGNIYLADTDNNRVRKISLATGIITTVAGTGVADFNGDGLLATETNFPMPLALAFDPAGNLYVGGLGDYRIRRIDAVTGIVSTVAGTGVYGLSGDGIPAVEAGVGVADMLAFDSAGNLFFGDSTQYYKYIRKIEAATGIVTTLVGMESSWLCGENVPARYGCHPDSQVLDIDGAGNLLFSGSNGRVRKIAAATDRLTTLAIVPNAWINGLGHDAAGNSYFSTSFIHRVYKVNATSGEVSVFAGQANSGFSGDGGPAAAATLTSPRDIDFDAAGNAYISDGGRRIRRVDAITGIITTFAGNSNSGSTGDGGPASAASFSGLGTLTFDAAGNLVLRDGCAFRRIDATTGIITRIAGNAGCAPLYTGDGGPALAARFPQFPSWALAPSGDIFLAWGEDIRRINAASGIVTTIPPPPGGFVTPEGLRLRYPSAMAFDAEGRLYWSTPFPGHIIRISGLVDTTPPEIFLNVVGTEGVNGWYRSDVTVFWSMRELESGSSQVVTSGCTQSYVTSDTPGVTFTCTATSPGGTNSRSVTIKRDTVAPQLTFATPTPTPDASGWNYTDVSVPFDASDDLSGVYMTSSGNPVIVPGEGEELTAEVVVTDQAGNTATFTTPQFKIDRSPPLIDVDVVGVRMGSEWYVSVVQVNWIVSDANTPITDRSGCETAIVAHDTAGQTITCTVTSGGGTTSRSVTISKDATPPTVQFGTPTPAPGSNGWYTGPVSIPYTVTDEHSGFDTADLPNPILISQEGAGLTRRLTVRDAAGNSATLDSPFVNIDLSPPTVQPLVSGTLGTNGWHTSDVHLAWEIGESPQSLISSSGCEAGDITADTSGITFTCSITSGGGSASSSITIKRDATPPVLNFGTPSPVPNANGWNKTNVSIAFTRSDALSGIANVSGASPLVLSTEGAGVSGQVTVTDNAGNTATFTSVPRNIDKTAPYAEMESPIDGGTYGFYQDVVADFVCEDISLLSCTAPTPLGELINTRTAGTRTFKVTAKDAVGFTTNHTHTFTVESFLNFEGFLGPVNQPPTLNLVTRGSMVPIRWRLPDGRGGFVSHPGSFTSATVGSLSCGSAPVVPLSDTAEGPAGLSFDESSGTFTYNWQTSSSWTGCRKLTIKLRDNTLHELRFRFQ